jgi:pimeloyl-ACP methyl ester carboxylesterase
VPDFVSTPDGRRLEILTGGAPDGLPFLFHGGTPSAALGYRPLWDAAARAGLRLVTYSRPGYGGSTPRPVGPPVPIAADAADSAIVLDALGMDHFVTLGWSGGGPRALACAALMPERCLAAVTLAGVAPADADDLDFTGGMGPENVRDFELASRGREALRPVVEEQVVEAFGGLVDEVDAAALTGELADYVAGAFRHAMDQGSAGLLEDNLQVMQPWGFDVADITVPVGVWQGAHDKMVPFAHGRWLAARIPGARVHLYEDEGHLSLVHRMDEMLAELVDLAGPRARS